jgi:hypothetical protein
MICDLRGNLLWVGICDGYCIGTRSLRDVLFAELAFRLPCFLFGATTITALPCMLRFICCFCDVG